MLRFAALAKIILREEHMLRDFENGVLRSMGLKGMR
jgi:hypothetical protein